MTDKMKRTVRWLLMLMICFIGARTLTGCVVDHDHDGHDHHDDHHDWH